MADHSGDHMAVHVAVHVAGRRADQMVDQKAERGAGRAAERRERAESVPMTDVEPVGCGFLARYRDHTYPAAIGPDSDDVVLFSEERHEGFEPAGGYWRLQVQREDLEWLMLIRTVGAFSGEPCVVLDEDEDGLHIAYTGHNGNKAESLGYWMVDHGAYEVVVPREEVRSIRVERVQIPCRPATPARDPAS